MGRNPPIDPIIELICRTFHVNKAWLVVDVGEMFEANMLPPPSLADTVMASGKLIPEMRPVVEMLLEMDVDQQRVIASILNDLVTRIAPVEADAVNAVDGVTLTPPPRPPLPRDMTDAELHAELQRQLDAERDSRKESAAYSSIA